MLFAARLSAVVDSSNNPPEADRSVIGVIVGPAPVLGPDGCVLTLADPEMSFFRVTPALYEPPSLATPARERSADSGPTRRSAR